MRLLLDTHVFIWALIDDPRLTLSAKTLIEAADEVHVSSASLWEIAIKAAIGKLDTDALDMVHAIEKSGFIELPISAAHAAHVSTLPTVEGHKDPFDRLLVAQSLYEPLVLLTADPQLLAYGALIRLV